MIPSRIAFDDNSADSWSWEFEFMKTDPVCGMKVDENQSQYQSQYGGQKYNFCSEDCKNKFDQKPEQYAKSAA